MCIEDLVIGQELRMVEGVVASTAAGALTQFAPRNPARYALGWYFASSSTIDVAPVSSIISTSFFGVGTFVNETDHITLPIHGQVVQQAWRYYDTVGSGELRWYEWIMSDNLRKLMDKKRKELGLLG